MLRPARFVLLAAFLLAACGESPVAPCETETRWRGSFEGWSIECRLAVDRPDVQVVICAVWNVPPEPPDWLGDFAEMQERGVLSEVTTCKDAPIG